VGIGDDHLVVPFENRREKDHHRRRGAGGDDDLFRANDDTVTLPVVIADRLSELRQSQTVGVVGFAFPQGSVSGRLNALRRIKIGLSDLEMNHILAIALHSLGGFQNFHDKERTNIRRSSGDHRRNLFFYYTPHLIPRMMKRYSEGNPLSSGKVMTVMTTVLFDNGDYARYDTILYSLSYNFQTEASSYRRSMAPRIRHDARPRIFPGRQSTIRPSIAE